LAQQPSRPQEHDKEHLPQWPFDHVRHPSKGWNDDLVREGFAECDNSAIQSMASVSNENWIEESAYRQKDRDNISLKIEPEFT
jgi:hypothetical protein